MKHFNFITALSLCVLSYQLQANSGLTFEKVASPILEKFSMQLGQETEKEIPGIDLEGRTCSIKVENLTKIAPSAPEFSKSNHQIVVVVEVDGEEEIFNLTRNSKVETFSHKFSTSGPSELAASVQNNFGRSGGRQVTQTIKIEKSSERSRKMVVSVKGSQGKTFTCIK